jgi:hypothetical protein
MNASTRTRSRSTVQAPLIRHYVQRIEAPPEIVFPLLCPVREGDWLEGWAESCEVIWSRSGLAEPGCVFRTTEDGRPETIWIVTEHDPDRGVVVFTRVTPGLSASILRLEVLPAGDGSSRVAISYSVIPTSDRGEADAAERYDRRGLLAAIAWWERSMNHYLQTGRLLRHVAGPSRIEKE